VRRPAARERLKRSHGTKAPLAWAGGPDALAYARPARRGGAALVARCLRQRGHAL